MSRNFLKAAESCAEYFASTTGAALQTLVPSALLDNYSKLSKSPAHEGPTFVAKEKGANEKVSDKKKIKLEKSVFQAPADERISFYKTCIRESFAKKQSVFLCLPTVSDISHYKETLSRGIEAYTFTFHSDLGAKEIVNLYNQVVEEKHPILMIATPPYASIPRPDIGTIILEHESSPAYKTVGRPYVDLRVFMEFFAHESNVRYIVGDTLLRFETIWRHDEHEFSEIAPISFRTVPDVKIEIENMRREDPSTDSTGSPQTNSGQVASLKKQFELVSAKTRERIEEAVREKKHLFLFALRRGMASVTICRDCGSTLECDVCSAPLVLYGSRKGGRIFACNKCKKEKDPNTVCKNCESWNLVPLGIGTELVYEYIKKNFPEVPLFRLDKEITKTALQAKRTIGQFFKGAGGILVGTEMALYYFTQKTDESVVISFDSLFTLPSFRMNEKIIQLVITLASYTERTLVIQSKNPDEKTLRALSSGNLLYVYRDELAEREEFGYPPFTTLIKISYKGPKLAIEREKKNLEELFGEYEPMLYQAYMPKVAGEYIIHATIKLPRKKWASEKFTDEGSIDQKLLQKLKSLPPSFKIQIDPEDLM